MSRSITNKKRILTKTAVMLLAFAVAFTTLPLATSSLTVDAKSKKAAKKIYASAHATGYTTATVSWNKIKKPEKGYAVFRDGSCIAHLGKGSMSYGDAGLAAGSYHTYQVKAYKKKTTKKTMWRNKYTGELRKKRPKKGKKDWKKKTIKTVKYTYKKSSNVASVSTPAMPAPAPAAPAPSGGNSGGNSGGSTPARTAYSCTDYLGNSNTLYKDAGGNYYLYQTGGSPVVLAKYDKTKDGTWTDQNRSFVQKNGTTVYYVASSETTTANVNIYNGSASKAKLEITETTATFQQGDKATVAGPAKYRDLNCVMSGEDRLASYELKNTSFSEYERRSISFCVGSQSEEVLGFDGYKDGTVHIDAWYDFNGDGTWSGSEKLGTMTRSISKTSRASKALEVAKAAMKDYEDHPENYEDLPTYTMPDYARDMQKIRIYMNNNYEYSNSSIDGSELNARCNGGAYVLKTWSAYKYHVYGFIGAAAGGDDHVAFYPGKDGVNKGVVDYESDYYEAQGHQ